MLQADTNAQSQGKVETLALVILAISLALPRKFMAIGVGIFLALAIVHGIINRKRSFEHTKNETLFTILFSAYFFLHVFSLLWTSEFARGLANLETKIYFLVLPVAFYFFRVRVHNPLLWYHCFVWAITGMIALCFADAFQYMIEYNDPITPFRYYNFAVRVGMHPGFLSMLILISLVCVGYLLQKRERKIILICLGSIQVFSLIFIGARFAIMALPVIIFFALVIAFYKRRNLIPIALVMLAIGFTLVFLGFKFSANARDRLMGAGESFEIRMGLYRSAFNLILDSPLIGYGVGGDQPKLLGEYRKRGMEVPFQEKYNVHSQYLQTLLETGLVGFTVFVCMLAGCVRCAPNRFLMGMVLMVFLIFFVVECVLERQFGAIPFVAWMTMLTFQKTNRQND